MNIKQASEQSGVSAPNIRFYEKEGLLTPARRQGNGYRDYTAGDIRTLKLIRMLRMLDVPLPTIEAVLRGEQPLQQALQAQQTVLEQQVAQLAAAMQFCADLARQAPQAETLDVDACLTRMEHPATQQGFFSGWLQDYRTLAQVQHQRHFSFIPEGSINTPQEFTAALRAYAEEKGMLFTLTKEGMYPEFLLDGIAYKAYRNPGKYRDEICCDAVHPEQLDTGLPLRREKLLRFLRLAVPPVCTFAAILAAGWVVTGGAGWLWLEVLASAGVLLERCLERWL
ncbi:MerR family transcriptional regulator [Faecalibacterium langellae]|uniref:MerR family transcriptional regulator n=1 Tax=Faecalibacterium langellae TaxID=3435293 RepID=A0A2A6Z7B1_9FIRM|nr:MerR family transcriptional regulator [Faecalibacterium prausnitzii]PDX57253.1 MerR family transcriptional regulator [Faecalibacterium prausnitzii]